MDELLANQLQTFLSQPLSLTCYNNYLFMAIVQINFNYWMPF